MKFLLIARHMKGGDPWEETYDKPELRTPEAVETWARQIVDWFNSTRRPGEQERQYLGVRLIAQSQGHRWYKSGAMTTVNHLGVYDTYRCQNCEVTGKRYGVSSAIKIDSKFRAKKYQICDRSHQ